MNGRPAVIVTGGGQGIGKATVRRLLDDGHAVVIADIDVEAGEEAVAEFALLGDVRFISCDVSSEDQVRAMIETTAGAGGIQGLVNNAGIPRFRLLEDATLDDWQAVIGVNLTGAFLCARYAAPYLRSAHGAIVNIASTRALMSEPGGEAYAASKGGLIALTHALAVSLGPEVRVNCISPGWIEVAHWKKRADRREPQHSDADRTQHPVGRVGRPEDVAAMVSFLLSDQAGFMTGANVVIDGGMTRKMIYAE
jgi:NAD(P)-dependent dehydrogenase (short-subunit alcohol dehydrogenase family)